MNGKINCTKCGKKGLAEYRMALMQGPNGFRRYSVCPSCAVKLGLGDAKPGRRQMRASKTRVSEVADAGSMPARLISG